MIQRRKRVQFTPGATEKACSRCRIIKPLMAFSVQQQGALGRNARCKDCIKGRAKSRLSRRLRPEACECCGSSRTLRRPLYWDRDAAGDLRGWLCHSCLLALRAVSHSAPRLLKLADYLNHSGPHILRSATH